VHRIEEGMLDRAGIDGGRWMERVAKQFGWSSRQIRRVVQRELGVSPMELVQTRRLLLAKQLLTETALPISEVAHASGYASLRRFNDAFGARYGIPPTRFRRDATARGRTAAAETFTLRLGYRPPFDWAAMLDFLRARQTQGVEMVTDDAYMRTVRLGTHTGWIEVRNDAARNSLSVTLPHSLTPALPPLLGRIRNLFDLAARPDVIAASLAKSRVLRAAVSAHPGLRVPGAFDGFELATRAILGQQITVKAATTLAGRFADLLGEPIDTPHSSLNRLTASAARVASARADQLSAIGIMPARAQSLIELARAMNEGLSLEPGSSPEAAIAGLVELPGIGAWTANYIAMRALRWTDAFPKEDIVLRKRLGDVTPSVAEKLSEEWRPWRSYATLHLWRSA
jgi:AraC family transcriptional regulator, regulatory protein of adaptative response / DNA-3-methyladenine glycosylase II